MTAPFLEDLPAGLVAEQRSAKRVRPWELWLFLGTIALFLLLACLVNHAFLSAWTGASADRAKPNAEAAAESSPQQDASILTAVPVDSLSVDAARNRTAGSAPDVPPAPSAAAPPTSQPVPSQDRASVPSTPPPVALQPPGDPAATAPAEPVPATPGPAATDAAPQVAAPTPDPAPSAPTAQDVPAPDSAGSLPSRVDSATAQASTAPAAGAHAAEQSSGTGPALYFASDIVLLSLLTQRHIEVYVKQGTQWSRVTLSGASVVDPPDHPLYRLRPDTVPDLLQRTLPSGTPASSDWAVWLDPAIADAVQQSRAGAGEQDLVIDRGGRVQLRPRDPSQAGSARTADTVPSG